MSSHIWEEFVPFISAVVLMNGHFEMTNSKNKIVVVVVLIKNFTFVTHTHSHWFLKVGTESMLFMWNNENGKTINISLLKER